MLRKTLLVMVIISLFVSIVPVNAAAPSIFTDVTNTFWGKASIDFVSQQGIIQGDGKGHFFPNNKVTVENFVVMLVRALGTTHMPYDLQQYVNTAMEIGLVAQGEFKDYKAPILRKDMAKLAIKAYEILNKGKTYPDYLDAYKGLVTDYSTLTEEDLRISVVKCVSEGIITGDQDGKFNPAAISTRAQAAAIIHRLLSDTERNKQKPVFATPDREFESFMASPEASTYVSTETIQKVVDGKIIYSDNGDWGDYGSSLLPAASSINPMSNKVAYDTINGLVAVARKYGHYVNVFYTEVYGERAIIIEYKDKKGNGDRSPMFSVTIYLRPYKYAYEAQKELSIYLWDIKRLFVLETYDVTPPDINFQQEPYKEALKATFMKVYGDALGMKFYNYAMKEYETEHAWDLAGKKYTNTSISYSKELGGLEIVNDIRQGWGMYFTTNMQKGVK